MIDGLGERLRKARQRSGLTLRDAQEITNIDFADLCKHEIGQRTPSLKTLYALCQAYQVSPNYLLCWSETLNEPRSVAHDMDFVRRNFSAKV